ncbi:MAG: hypothetical protein KDJ65_06265 [Anaerolineae bacterium]|nr:hypothetical protein [Anaerolineae bacterium]
MNSIQPPRQVKAWYGLTGEIVVENELWHLVKVGGVPLNHPPVINLILRRKLPRQAKLRLSYLHEFGHFQTLPLALAYLLLLFWAGRRPQRWSGGWIGWGNSADNRAPSCMGTGRGRICGPTRQNRFSRNLSWNA